MKNWRMWLVVLGLLASAGTGAGLLRDAGWGGYTPLRVVTTLTALVLAVSMVRPVLAMMRNPVVLAFLAWSVASLIWTEQRGETFTTLVGLGGTFLFAVVLAVLQRTHRIDAVMMWTFTATTVLSYVLIFAVPSIGTREVVHPTEGVLQQPQGIFIWNSDLGFSASIAAVIALATFFQRWRVPRWELLVVALLNMGMVVVSNAATSVIVLALGLVVLVLTSGRRVALGATILGVAAVAAGVIAWGATGALDKVLGILGRSSSLTGRSHLWKSTIEQAEGSEWLGKGAGVEPSFIGLSRAEHSHNGFVQLYFDRGIPGGVLVILIFLAAIFLAARQRDRLAFAILAMVAMANMANNYLSYASLGLLLLLWVSHVGLPREQGLRLHPRPSGDDPESDHKGVGEDDEDGGEDAIEPAAEPADQTSAAQSK